MTPSQGFNFYYYSISLDSYPSLPNTKCQNCPHVGRFLRRIQRVLRPPICFILLSYLSSLVFSIIFSLIPLLFVRPLFQLQMLYQALITV
jgi:hypothetical protein